MGMAVPTSQVSRSRSLAGFNTKGYEAADRVCAIILAALMSQVLQAILGHRKLHNIKSMAIIISSFPGVHYIELPS